MALELNASELGTQEYWDAFYQTELQNFIDHQDEGEIWFGKESESRILTFLLQETSVDQSKAVVDLGCGNGHLARRLVKEGFKHVIGVDYSAQAVELCKRIHSYLIEKNESNCNECYQQGDILSVDFLKSFSSPISIAIDKGTYDAISLMPEDALTKRRTYRRHILNLLLPSFQVDQQEVSGVFLVLTSCNWTLDELVAFFTAEETHHETGTYSWRFIKELPAKKTFQFGGQKGNTTTAVVFVPCRKC